MNKVLNLARNLGMVKDEIDEAATRSGRKASDITLLAVSKRHPVEYIEELSRIGHRDFGESYVQEALEKQEKLSGTDIRWHFIGGLQSNKAKFVAGQFDLVHSVDSAKLARVLHKKALERNCVQKVLLQVNIAGEAQKSGINEGDLQELADETETMDGIEVVGLMTMPPFDPDPERSRPVFARLRELKSELEKRLGRDLEHLSMGMTGDYVQAIEEGATILRIGTRIFGPRPCAI